MAAGCSGRGSGGKSAKNEPGIPHLRSGLVVSSIHMLLVRLKLKGKNSRLKYLVQYFEIFYRFLSCWKSNWKITRKSENWIKFGLGHGLESWVYLLKIRTGMLSAQLCILEKQQPGCLCAQAKGKHSIKILEPFLDLVPPGILKKNKLGDAIVISNLKLSLTHWLTHYWQG